MKHKNPPQSSLDEAEIRDEIDSMLLQQSPFTSLHYVNMTFIVYSLR